METCYSMPSTRYVHIITILKMRTKHASFSIVKGHSSPKQEEGQHNNIISLMKSTGTLAAICIKVYFL